MRKGTRWRPKALDTTPAESREWLIWSMYHRCWHRRSSVGGASGYTSNILEAGLFETKKAREYHDGMRDRAIHISRRRAEINGAYNKLIDRHETALAIANELLSGFPKPPQS